MPRPDQNMPVRQFRQDRPGWQGWEMSFACIVIHKKSALIKSKKDLCSVTCGGLPAVHQQSPVHLVTEILWQKDVFLRLPIVPLPQHHVGSLSWSR